MKFLVEIDIPEGPCDVICQVVRDGAEIDVTDPLTIAAGETIVLDNGYLQEDEESGFFKFTFRGVVGDSASGAPALAPFRDIDARLYWKGAALEQLKFFEVLARSLGVECRVAGSHRSKSIELPVVLLERADGTRVYLRDNFYDVNVCVVSPTELTHSLEELFAHNRKDWNWYLDQIARCEGYSWVPGKEHHKGAEKIARWKRRLEDPAWWRHDWSSGVISYEGTFGPGAALYVQPYTFAEGIEDAVSCQEKALGALKPYRPGCHAFIAAMGREQVAEFIQKI